MNDEEFQKFHIPKPCMFCPNMAGYHPLDEMSKHGIGVYYCQLCQAEYLFFKNGDKASTSLYTSIKDKMYRWTVTSVGTAQLWYVTKPGIPGKQKNEGMVAIKGFSSDIPQLTPENINEKIRTWLLFL